MSTEAQMRMKEFLKRSLLLIRSDRKDSKLETQTGPKDFLKTSKLLQNRFFISNYKTDQIF